MQLLQSLLIVSAILVVFAQGQSFLHHYDKPLATVEVYYESLSYDCQQFFHNELRPAYYKLGKYIKLKLIPWGFARMDDQGFIRCDHGPKECFLNAVHACTLHLTNSTGRVNRKAFNMAICLFDADHESAQDLAQECCDSNDLEWKTIEKCVNGEKSREYLQDYARRTHRFWIQQLPYVVINGQQTDGGGYSLTEYLCNFVLDNVPDACNEYIR